MYRKYVEPGFKPRRNEMLDVIRARVKPLGKVERIPFSRAVGRVCAQDVFSRNTLPNLPVSRFDGIGVRYDDFCGGIPDTSGWKLGFEYTFCNTGIAVPNGFDTVIAIEDVDIEDGVLTIHEGPTVRGEYVGQVGGNMREGEKLIAAGTVITPAHIGLFASGGIEEVEVAAMPVVAVIPTGNELVPPTANVAPGKNVESNSYMIHAYLSGWGAAPVLYPVCKDDPDQLREVFQRAVAASDMVAVIAGSSLGSEDYTMDTLKQLGDVVVPELAHGPGRKSSLTFVGDKPIMGVAGPPLGAQIACELYMHPIINALLGQPYVAMPTLEAVTDDAFVEHDVDFCERVHIYKAADGYHIRSALKLGATRAQMEAITNGNYYRAAGTSHEIGDSVCVERMCPLEYIPNEDMTLKIVEEAEAGKA